MQNTIDNRLASLDALRGFDMMFIMGVSSLIIAICSLFPNGADCALALQMQHAEWDGFRHHDTIFPLFLFIAGISFPFSYAKMQERGVLRWKIYRKIVTRCMVLFLLGLICNGLFKLHFDSIRIFSVLGRIGFAWMFAALMYINLGSRTRGVIAAAILLGYWWISMIPAPDIPGANPLSREGCLAGYIDRSLFEGHLYKTDFDPEGLLSLLPSIVTAMLGMFTGEFVRRNDLSGNKKTLWMLCAATIMLAVCLVWKEWLPVNKQLWSSTFVLAAGSYSLYMFALFYWIIDVKGWDGWIFPFRVIGLNSIAIFMIPRFINLKYTRDFFFKGTAELFPEQVGLVILLASYVLVDWLLAYFLYKQKIFLKV